MVSNSCSRKSLTSWSNAGMWLLPRAAAVKAPLSGRLRVHVPAAGGDRTAAACRPLGVARSAPVRDQVDVRLVHLVGLEHRQEHLVRLVGRGFRRDQADSLRDALDVA